MVGVECPPRRLRLIPLFCKWNSQCREWKRTFNSTSIFYDNNRFPLFTCIAYKKHRQKKKKKCKSSTFFPPPQNYLRYNGVNQRGLQYYNWLKVESRKRRFNGNFVCRKLDTKWAPCIYTVHLMSYNLLGLLLLPDIVRNNIISRMMIFTEKICLQAKFGMPASRVCYKQTNK